MMVFYQKITDELNRLILASISLECELNEIEISSAYAFVNNC
jgi:hypothetical protein